MSKDEQQSVGDGLDATASLLILLQQFTMETDRFINGLSTKHHLHRTDLSALGSVMASLRRGEAATPGKLGQELNLSSPATTALIDRLDRAGHITRRRSETDRRQVNLDVTPLARETGKALFGPLNQHLGAVAASYSDEEKELVTRFMSEIIAATIRAREE